MSRWRRAVPPVLILAVGVFATLALMRSRPRAEKAEPEIIPPLVRVMQVQPDDLRLTVTAEGTVLPRTETNLAAQVAAQVVSVAPSFEVGGFFKRGEILVSLDARDFEVAVERTKAQVAVARLRLVQEEAEARVAAEEWQELGNAEANALVLREPQLAEARAALAAAEAELKKANLDLERTRIQAPFSGRVRSKQADIGQYLTPGQTVATIHAIDYAEVRLPVPDHQLASLDLPLTYRDRAAPPGPDVTLSAQLRGKRHSWPARIVRTEGEIDAKSRMHYLVARVEDPYGRSDGGERPPLVVGLYVQAEIAGREAPGAIVVPRSAVRDDGRVLIVDDESRLRFRAVEILRRQAESVILAGGLAAGERVCISPLDVAVDGMEVRAVLAEADS